MFESQIENNGRLQRQSGTGPGVSALLSESWSAFRFDMLQIPGWPGAPSGSSPESWLLSTSRNSRSTSCPRHSGNGLRKRAKVDQIQSPLFRDAFQTSIKKRTPFWSLHYSLIQKKGPPSPRLAATATTSAAHVTTATPDQTSAVQFSCCNSPTLSRRWSSASDASAASSCIWNPGSSA